MPTLKFLLAVILSITVVSSVVLHQVVERRESIYIDGQSADGTLKYGSPESVGLLSGPLRSLAQNMSGFLQIGSDPSGSGHPIQPAAAVIVGHKGVIVSKFADGQMSLYSDSNGTYLTLEDQIQADVETIWDLASLTKLFTTIAAMQQLDKERLKLESPVAHYVPRFAVNGKENITILMLLTHTSGFDSDPSPSLYSSSYTTSEERRNAIIEQNIINTPGSTYLYSDLNFMTLMIVLEAITGKKIDALIGSFTSELGMRNTFFNRGNIEGPRFSRYSQMAAQEFQIEVLGNSEPLRPQPVRGTVHDENAWALDGVSGHAGLFSTIQDIAIFCQMILNNGTYGGKRIVQPQTIDLIFHDYNARFPGNSHGLGFELNQTYWSGPMRSIQTAGHTGYVGTSLAIDRPSNTFFVLLTNNVHPSRNWPSNNPARKALGYWVALALGRKNVVYPN